MNCYYHFANNSTKATCQDEPSNIKLYLRHVGNRLIKIFFIFIDTLKLLRSDYFALFST